MYRKVLFLVLIFNYMKYTISYNHEIHPQGNLMLVPHIEKEILDKLEKFRTTIPEPYILQDFNINLPQNEYLNGQISITNLNVSGVKSFKIKNVNYNWLTHNLELYIHFEKIDVALDYNTNITIGISTDVYADDVQIRNSITGLEFQTNSKPFHLLFKPHLFSLKSKMVIEGVKFLIHGFLNDEDLNKEISDSVNSYFVKYIDDQADFIEKIGSPVVQNVLNSILRHHYKL